MSRRSLDPSASLARISSARRRGWQMSFGSDVRIVRQRSLVGPEDVIIAVKPALEVGSLGKLELGFGLGVTTLRLKVTKTEARAASEDEHAFADGMVELAMLEAPVLHGREQILQPEIRA